MDSVSVLHKHCLCLESKYSLIKQQKGNCPTLCSGNGTTKTFLHKLYKRDPWKWNFRALNGHKTVGRFECYKYIYLNIILLLKGVG